MIYDIYHEYRTDTDTVIEISIYEIEFRFFKN